MADVNIYSEVKRTNVNILIESPRKLFRKILDGKNCGWNKQKVVIKKTFPLKSFTIQSSIDNRTCENYLGIFDQMIKATLDEKLVTHLHSKRRTARSPASLAVVPLLIGVTGFFSFAAGQSAHDESKRRMEREERERIASINAAFQLNANNIATVARYMQTMNGEIATVAPLEAPAGTLASLKHAFSSEHGLGEFVINFSQTMADKVIQQMLDLTNNRLPTDVNFVNSMRAACLSQQIDQTDETTEHCRQFAFHTTRWDTSLKFAGVGLVSVPENLDNLEGVLLSLSVDIPVYEFTGAGYRTHNLGFFTAPNVRQMLQVPKFITVYPNGAARGMVKSRCLSFNNGFACQSDLLEPHPCVEQSFLNITTLACSPIRVDPSKCGVWQTSELMAISVPKPSEIEFFHKEPNRLVDAIDVFNKSSNPAAVHCGNRTIKIRPIRKHTTFNTTITYLSPERITIDDGFQKFLTSLQQHSEDIGNKTSSVQSYATDTRHFFSDFKKHVQANFATAEERVKNWLHVTIASVSGIVVLLLIFLVIGVLAFRKFTAQNQPSPVILGLSPPPQRNQRQDQCLNDRAANTST